MKHLRDDRKSVSFKWPVIPFNIALVEPEIPPNTGNIARLCAATGTRLHLVGRLGFSLDNRYLKRAGLDYWDSVKMTRHSDFAAFCESMRDESAGKRQPRLLYFSTRGEKSYLDADYTPGDALVFGCETKGLPDNIIEANRDMVFCIPIRIDAVRSLNLSTAAGIVLYEALRQVEVRGRQ